MITRWRPIEFTAVNSSVEKLSMRESVLERYFDSEHEKRRACVV